MFGTPQRSNGQYNGRLTSSNGNDLLQYSSSSAVQEKLGRRSGHHSPWLLSVPIPLPGLRHRALRFWVPNPRRLHHFTTVRFGRKRGTLFLCFAFLVIIFVTVALIKRLANREPPTLVYKRQDLRRIWHWEVSSGHYPSRHSIPEQLGFQYAVQNPALPPRRTSLPLNFKRPLNSIATSTNGVGPKRTYLELQSQRPNVAYPPRPVPGSIADLDIVMEHCDFSEKKFVRDCLEVLRIGAGLDNGQRVRRGNMDDWKYIYMETPESNTTYAPSSIDVAELATYAEDDSVAGFTKKRGSEWEIPPISLPPPRVYRPYPSLPTPCDTDYPRIFHMFWTGPFTDKPYLALLSFLFTQKTGLHLHNYSDATACRPKFWLWVNPGPAASVPNPSAYSDMVASLRDNPWSAPFLHDRFKDIIEFKLWNTTEQLDGIPELKHEWRSRTSLFNSGGQVYKVPKQAGPNSSSKKAEDDDMANRLGSKSSSSYDRLSVILSDMARFILCHRFGGIYLDADTIFLRDWEELWGWKGAFAYRWSRLEKYNTAVLHLNKGSALGTFLFRTALKNDLDFHPMTVARYVKEARLDGLLLRLPDALFDSAWLNTEYYQRERPPQPYFTDFGDFFDTPKSGSAAPHALGFDGFFKGAFSYHFHNYWWKPFDPARNWPDLGSRFADGERKWRLSLSAARTSTSQQGSSVEEDRRDLDWSTVLKRTFESYIRGERPNMYGEWLEW